MQSRNWVRHRQDLMLERIMISKMRVYFMAPFVLERSVTSRQRALRVVVVESLETGLGERFVGSDSSRFRYNLQQQEQLHRFGGILDSLHVSWTVDK